MKKTLKLIDIKVKNIAFYFEKKNLKLHCVCTYQLTLNHPLDIAFIKTLIIFNDHYLSCEQKKINNH